MTAISTVDETFLFDFILTLLNVLVRDSNDRQINMYAFGFQFTHENLPFPFIQLKNSAMKASVEIAIFQSYSGELLVREQSYYPATTIRSRRPGQRHRHATHLPVLLADRYVPNEVSGYLRLNTLRFSKSQSITLNKEVSRRVARDAFETQYMRNAQCSGTRIRSVRCALILPYQGRARAHYQCQSRKNPSDPLPSRNRLDHASSPKPELSGVVILIWAVPGLITIQLLRGSLGDGLLVILAIRKLDRLSSC